MRISCELAHMDVSMIHHFLSTASTWAIGIPLATVARSLQHSLCFGGFDENGKQIAFARVVSDRATFAYLMDVFVVPEQRGLGHGKTIVQAVLDHPELQGLRRFMLASANARDLYQRLGFSAPAKPETLMEINRRACAIYQRTE
jgi:GNAT superfamily N-acetyltransferase